MAVKIIVTLTISYFVKQGKLNIISVSQLCIVILFLEQIFNKQRDNATITYWQLSKYILMFNSNLQIISQISIIEHIKMSKTHFEIPAHIYFR